LSFEALPRFSDLMEQHSREYPQVSAVCPRMVSFVGGSGTGKSTLIHILIRQLWNSTAGNKDSRTLVPVVGDNSTIPTSADIHLYHDSIGDANTPEIPLLFADCEGFDGANQSSAATIVAETRKAIKNKEHSEDVETLVSSLIQATKRIFKRTLGWFQSVNSRRQDALELLFPRLLYIFSDVIVYVITETESRRIGNILEKLVKWSEETAVAAINRVSPPSLIVVLNQSKPSGTDWNPKATTDRILKENQGLMTTNPTLKTHKARLESLGLDNCSLEAILKCAYSSVEFVRIPRGDEEKDLPLLASQLERLRTMIGTAATQAHNAKAAANTLLSSEYQNSFYHLAFEHFSIHKDRPFDYMETFFSLHPLPTNFANTLTGLFRATLKGLTNPNQVSFSEALAHDFLKVLIPVVSSGVVVDILHSSEKLPGSLSDLIQGERATFKEWKLEMRQFSFENQIATAIQQFLETSCQCAFTNPETGKRCAQYAIAHGGGLPHKDADGNNIGFGTFGNFEENCFHQTFLGQAGWEKNFSASIATLEAILAAASSSDQISSPLAELWRLRKQYIRHMYDLIPNFDFPDQSGCFWCLRNIPDMQLPCGHLICESCISQIGELSPHDDRVRLLRQCDRHPGGKILDPPFEVSISLKVSAEDLCD
jgi:hypothetical protein